MQSLDAGSSLLTTARPPPDEHRLDGSLMHEQPADRPLRRQAGVDEDGLWSAILPHPAQIHKGYDAFRLPAADAPNITAVTGAICRAEDPPLLLASPVFRTLR